MQEKQHQKLKAFLDKYQPELSKQVKSTSIQSIKASILSTSDLEFASHELREGRLVAFPTQTVYGLGANACNEDALRSIYTTKRRPLTDPIIVHVLDSAQAQKLVQMQESVRTLFLLLTNKFWPGPLTVILKANLEVLPMIVTAQTGFVGVRAPKHAIARKIIQLSGLPIGAPSANLFSHVSPTQPVHVFNDFYNCPISIVDGQRCEYGVESTVIKLISDKQIHVFREGSLSVRNLQVFLKNSLHQKDLPSVIVHKRIESKHKNMEAPGQLLKHYAPYLPCYLVTNLNQAQNYFNQVNNQRINLEKSAVISFSSQFQWAKIKSKYFFTVGENLLNNQNEQLSEELFCSKQQKQQMRQIYYLLRKCENLQAQAILIAWEGNQQGTVWDKIFRSTQGQLALPIQ